MGVQKWNDIKHKASPEKQKRIEQGALAEYDRMGYASVRKARALTQVELADRLGLSQASLSAMENRADLQLSTLAKYIRAMGGELELHAVFPEATFNLMPLPPVTKSTADEIKSAPRSADASGRVPVDGSDELLSMREAVEEVGAGRRANAPVSDMRMSALGVTSATATDRLGAGGRRVTLSATKKRSAKSLSQVKLG